MANKISVLIDVATDKAVSGLKGFKASINDADGAMGKMKAGAASAFDSIKANAGNMALAAGAALVTFGVKAVGAFQDAALGAGKFADATGVSTEEASRWVAVADDIGISAETMEKSFGKLAVSVGKNNPLLEEYGITVQKNAAGQDDMNATMLHAIDVIKGIQDPTKRAAVAQAALGKGWMDMAELIEQGSDTLTTSMAEVSEAQVIDPEEVEKARKMRESMDNLNDAVGDLALVMGEELVPMAGMAADALTAVIGPLSDLNQWSKRTATSFYELIGVAEKQKEALDPLIFGYGVMGTALDAAADSGDTVEEVMKGVTDAINVGTKAAAAASIVTKDFTKAMQANADATNLATTARRSAADATFALHEAEKALAESLLTVDQELLDSSGNLLEQRSILEGVAQKAIAVADAQVRIALETAKANGSVLTAKQQSDLFRSSLASQATQLSGPSRQALLDYIATLNAIPTHRTTVITTDTRGLKQYASGTASVPGPRGAPQLAIVHGGEEIRTTAQVDSDRRNGSSSNAVGATVMNVTVNAGMGADGKEIGDIIVGKIREYERRNGNGWRG